MPCWYFDKHELKHTPSFRDGIDSEFEAKYRREGAGFIMSFGNQMGLRRDTMATGVVFFHRFYMFHSFNEFPRYVMATCCLFLAGKVEETPKKCKDLVKAAKQWLEVKNLKKHLDTFGEDPSKDIMIYERILLQTIKFDLQVDHPYGYLLKYAKTLKGNQEQITAMVQMAWTFINDSYSTTLCLQWEPEIIAIALMYLTSKLSKLEITDWVAKKENNALGKQNWWDQFVESLRIDILEDVCHQILDLYANQQQEQQQQQAQNNKPKPLNEQQSVESTVYKRKTPPPSLAYNQQQPQSLTNETLSSSPTSAKMLRTTNNSESYPIYNASTPSTNTSSNLYYNNTNIYPNQAYLNNNNNQIQPPQQQSAYHHHQHHGQPIYSPPAVNNSMYQSYYTPQPGVTTQPPIPQSNQHHFNQYSNIYQANNPYIDNMSQQFNNNSNNNNNNNNPYSMYSTNTSYLQNGTNLSQYNNIIKENNESINRSKPQHFSSSNSIAPNPSQMRTSALKTVNISDRPI